MTRTPNDLRTCPYCSTEQRNPLLRSKPCTACGKKILRHMTFTGEVLLVTVEEAPVLSTLGKYQRAAAALGLNWMEIAPKDLFDRHAVSQTKDRFWKATNKLDAQAPAVASTLAALRAALPDA